MPERTATEPLDFVHRYTNLGDGEVRVEVGDKFTPSPAWADDDNGLMGQIGLDLVSKGLQFLGHDADSRKMFCALALKSTDGAEWTADA